jgi:glycosyltransferase involved in cell wall biosynthesis
MHVLRLCSVYEPPASALTGRGAGFDPIGGMQNHTGQLSRALDRLGVRQTVVTTRPPTAPAESPLGQHGRVVRLGLPIPACRQFYGLAAWRRLPRLANDVDLVHAHLGEDLAIMPLAVRAALRAVAPLVVTIHCSLRYTLPVTDPHSLLLKTLGGALEWYGTGRAAAIITLTERLRRVLPGDNVHVVPSGIGVEFTAEPDGAGLPADVPRPRIGYVGRLHEQKGVGTLLCGFALLAGDTAAHLVIVGNGPDGPRLRRLAARLGIADRTRFLGFVPHSRMPAVLRDLDVLVLPSRYEELGSVLLEAMYAGVPIVASEVGGIPELIVHRRNGLLIPPSSPIRLAAAVRELIAGPEPAAALAARAHERVREQTWDKLVYQVLDVYRSVLPAVSAIAGPRDR